MNEVAMRLVFGANVLVAGAVGASCLFAPSTAGRQVFSGAAPESHPMTVVGALWLAIALLSLLGLAFPRPMAAVLLLQLLYKGSWLLVAALPWFLKGRTEPFPTAMAIFFLVWVLILPFVIPWSHLFSKGVES